MEHIKEVIEKTLDAYGCKVEYVDRTLENLSIFNLTIALQERNTINKIQFTFRLSINTKDNIEIIRTIIKNCCIDGLIRYGGIVRNESIIKFLKLN